MQHQITIILFMLIIGLTLIKQTFSMSEEKMLKYSEHFKMIFTSQIVTILDNDRYYFESLPFHKNLCPIINKKKEYNSVVDFVEDVKKEFLTKIYNKKNFVFTYRDNVELLTNEEDIDCYSLLHKCYSEIPVYKTIFSIPYILFTIVIYVIILFALAFVLLVLLFMRS